ncbi:hypothetical protein BpsM61_00054 [Bacillus phage vB_BpsM-61]|nr:hypothetical protein BpsM61_00054 [Bacillus phage vB_BpsM-61]
MKPPMHDPVILQQELLVNGEPVKDDRGFPQRVDIPVTGRVKYESRMVVDPQGQTKQTTCTVLFPPNVIPKIGDIVDTTREKVMIMQIKSRVSWNGKKVYYWVANCG